MDRIHFKINGISCSVGEEITSDVTLLDYIRNTLQLSGTKYMCREGGCGACIVTAVKDDSPPKSVNSCLVPVMSCQDWDITTIENLGSRQKGYHRLQKTLADHNGTQCGYCTPGWIMAMNSIVSSAKKPLTMLEIERSFGSNVCRCTGYRPILDAFKTFAGDYPKADIDDIEDISFCKINKNRSHNLCKRFEDWCIVTKNELETNTLEITLKDGRKWYKPGDLRKVFKILKRERQKSYMLVNGNTAKGAYPIEEYPEILIDISSLSELKGYYLDQNLVVGAGTTLTEFLDICERMMETDEFCYLQKFYEHIKLVAHIPVRNTGSIGGNLMIKHQDNNFPSDLFLLFEAVGAEITIIQPLGIATIQSMQNFLRMDMNNKIIYNILLPPLCKEHKLITFKIMPKSQNAHAIVNAGYVFKLSDKNEVLNCRIVYGGLSPTFIRAAATESFLIGKKLFTNETLRAAMKVLETEMIVIENPPEPTAVYRKQLAYALLYKALLQLCPSSILGSRYKSGAVDLKATRPVSQARQVFDTDPTQWPLTKPIMKIEAMIQCSGEAMYIEDLPPIYGEVFGAFVLSSVALGEIDNIDPGTALKTPGVLAFYTAKDIPGLNSFNSGYFQLDFINNEEILCSGSVKYFHQPLGIIVAETRHLAEIASKMVTVKYKNIQKPVIDTDTAVKDSKRVNLFKTIDATNKGNDTFKVIKGENTIHGQYHFAMETLVCICKPTEEGMEVHVTTQWVDGVQHIISRVLNMDVNRIDVYVKRLGGAYGIKISRGAQVAAACCLVTYKLRRPCRFILPLTTCMRAVGKRLPARSEFEVGLNKSGVIQYLKQNFYEDFGHMVTEAISSLSATAYSNCYDISRWNFNSYTVTTDTPKNTWCRAPGTTEAIAMAELILERVSYEMTLDPVEVRLANLDPEHIDLKEMIATIKTNSDYTNRRNVVDRFNTENKWKKRGLRMSLLRWTPGGFIYFDVNIAVYHPDGTICITHGGIEMGQGVNTKAVQICSYLLNVPIDKIQVKTTNSMVAPNSFISGGSILSQSIALGVQRACEELLKRLEPVRQSMKNPSWNELIKKAFESDVDLQAHGFVRTEDIKEYHIYGVTLAEVEVDVLTGESQVLRVDILEDVGQSVSPGIDVGQIEGAFIMGMGYWTSEKLAYNNVSGEILTDRSWNYYVPQAQDIPQDFRVYFRRKSYGERVYYGAKATGEPPLCMSIAVPLAIREALVSAREESGIPSTTWFPIDGPYTVESIYLAGATKTDDFKFY